MHDSREFKLLNAVQTAECLGISPKMLEKNRFEGGGPAFVKIGRGIRYRKKDLEEFIESNLRSSTSEFSYPS